MRWCGCYAVLLLALASLCLTSAAEAQSAISVEAAPLFGDASVHHGHWFELLVRVHNNSSASFNGGVEVFGSHSEWNNQHRGRIYAPLQVAAGTTVTLRLPVVAGYTDEPQVRVNDSAGTRVFSQQIRAASAGQTLLLNVSRSAALSAHLGGMPVTGGYEPWSDGAGYSSSTTTAALISARYDDVTGAPLLPYRAAGYSRIAAVLLSSDQLTRMGAQELEALGGYLMGGGTLALVIARPEDMRHPTIRALTGGDVQETAPAASLTAPITLLPPTLGGGMPVTLPSAVDPPNDLKEQLRGYSGGNLQPSSYGASAPYGLGEVHLLGFDPNRAPANDAAWVHVRLLDLLRRANERTSGALIRHGEDTGTGDAIQKRLDPNQGARWAIVVATLLLLGYAVVAGPVSYNHYRSRNQPLSAIAALPVLSLGTFILIFLLGLAAKGVSGRARHLVLVDAGAGMHVGVARRYRAFFVPSARTITVSARSSSAVLMTKRDGYQLNDSVTTVVDQNGSRLLDAELHPWEAHLVREDDYADLGGGVSMQPDKAGNPVITNHTGRTLEGLLLVFSGDGLFLPSLADGTSAHMAEFQRVTHAPLTSATWHSGMPYHRFHPSDIESELEDADGGLTDAWEAVGRTQDRQCDWFPDGVPVLLAQIAGAEGTKTDAGLKVDEQRMLLRVVGWGGKP